MRRTILMLAGLVLAMACLWLLLHKTNEAKPTDGPQPQSASVTNHGMVVSPQTAAAIPARNAPAPVVGQTPPTTSLLSHPNRTIAGMWQKPLDFYGRVIDENSNGIAGVSITFHWTDLAAPNQNRTASTISDSDGLFSLRGKRGGSMTLWFSKEGYYASQNGQRSFNYAVGPDILSPDPQKPVVFQMRKKGQGAELVTSRDGMQSSLPALVPINGEPVTVDLLQRKVGASGDLELSQIKPDRSQLPQATNWSFHMTISTGGFIEEDDAFPFTAPESGYQRSVDLKFARGTPGWATQISKTYYVAFGQPQKYGWLRVEANIAQQTVFLTYAVNPTGSRNLEPVN